MISALMSLFILDSFGHRNNVRVSNILSLDFEDVMRYCILEWSLLCRQCYGGSEELDRA